MKTSLTVAASVILLVATRTASAAAAERIVLPTNVTPLHYEIEFTPQPDKLTFTGHVRIDLTVNEPARTIKFNAGQLEFDKVSLSGEPAAPAIALDTKQETATLEFAHVLPRGNYALTIDYHGKIFRSGAGLFALDYTGVGNKKQRALYTQFENSDARKFVPCWDEPGIKATFSLTAVVPTAQLAFSNMPIAASKSAGKDLTKVSFQVTPKMSVYLLFFAVGDFERVHRQVGDIDLGIVVKRGDTARGQFALNAGAELLPYFNEYFGTPFPLPKLDFLAGPGASEFFGAMENWGAIFYFDQDVLIDSRTSTLTEKQRVYYVVAHEMAHQWFGDLVTMAWWEDLWLNEGFASWMENKATDHFHPQWKMWLQNADDKQDAMHIDAARGTHPVITTINDVVEASDAFDTITYSKGAAVVRMLESYVGADAFRAGVRNYMAKHAYGNTVSDDLWREIDAVSPLKITGIAHDFTLQAGVPLITLDKESCVDGSLSVALKQTRFAIDESGAAGAQVWHAPIELRSTQVALGAKTVVAGPMDTTVAVPGCGAALVNAGQTSYVRSRYDESALGALADQFGALSADDQKGILNDAAELAESGAAPMSGFLNVLAHVPAAADPVVWLSVTRELNVLDQMYKGLPGREAFAAFGREILRPAANEMGWDAKSGEAENVALKRAAVLTTLGKFDDADTIAEARRRFTNFLKAPLSLDPTSRRIALRVTAFHADEKTWEQLHALARTAKSPTEQQEFYGLLGLAGDPQLVQRTLRLSIATEVPETLRPVVLRLGSERHPAETLTFAIEHWSELEHFLEPNTRFQFLPRIVQSGSDPVLIEQLKAFNAANAPPTALAASDKAISIVRYNAGVRSRLGAVDQWIATRPHGTAVGAKG